MRQPTLLSPAELDIMQLAAEDPNLFCDYFFRAPGMEHGWMFDDNFVPEGAWQEKVHAAAQKDITVIGGFGTGKTSGVGMSACVWAALTPDFRFLNVAPKAWQAKLMYDAILIIVRNTRFEDLIWEKPRKPYPKLVLRYKIGELVYESTLEFMSADKDATGILSWEGDWLHVDEAGLLDNLEEVIINAGSRLRGSVRGRERLGRFSMASNSWDNFQLWYYFDQAASDPENFLSIVVSSRHNKNITPEQLQRMVARIPKDERDRFIEGLRPEGRGWYFNKESIYACEDPYIGQFVMQKVQEEDHPGYEFEKVHGVGVVSFKIPPKKNHYYMVIGDPGTDNAPKRNSPVLIVWDVTNFPQSIARVVGFWWGAGNGRIGPFVEKMFDFMALYRPIYTGIDSTGTQKNVNYLINEYLLKERFGEDKIGLLGGIGALDFSGSGKSQHLQAARLLIEAELLSWPKSIVGFRSQLSNYDPEKDKKIAQDIVATVGMSAHAIRTWFHVDPEELLAKRNTVVEEIDLPARRLPDRGRARRSIRIRQKERVPQETKPYN